MPKFASEKDDAKAKKRADNERQLTIVMMVYICIFTYFLFNLKKFNHFCMH